MKLFFVAAIVASVFSAVKPDDPPPMMNLKEAEEACEKEKNINVDLLTKADAGIFTSETDNMNCFAECMFYKLGFMKPDSTELFIEPMRNKAREHGGEKYIGIVDTCIKKKGATNCETAYQIYKCYSIERNKPSNNRLPSWIFSPAAAPAATAFDSGAAPAAVPIPAASPVAAANPAPAPAAVPAPVPAAVPAPAPAAIPAPVPAAVPAAAR